MNNTARLVPADQPRSGLATVQAQVASLPSISSDVLQVLQGAAPQLSPTPTSLRSGVVRRRTRWPYIHGGTRRTTSRAALGQALTPRW